MISASTGCPRCDKEHAVKVTTSKELVQGIMFDAQHYYCAVEDDYYDDDVLMRANHNSLRVEQLKVELEQCEAKYREFSALRYTVLEYDRMFDIAAELLGVDRAELNALILERRATRGRQLRIELEQYERECKSKKE